MQSSISSLIAASEDGDQSAARTLFAALYSQLHRVAQRQLARGGYGATLGPTTLLHEAYLDIAGRDARSFPDEARFLRYASRVMRGLIIEHARRRHAQKRGGAFHITAVDVEDVAGDHPDADELCLIGEALDDLAGVDVPMAELVDLKFFCGFSFADIAAMRGVCERTVQRDWEKARIYLHRHLRSRL